MGLKEINMGEIYDRQFKRMIIKMFNKMRTYKQFTEIMLIQNKPSRVFEKNLTENKHLKTNSINQLINQNLQQWTILNGEKSELKSRPFYYNSIILKKETNK